MRKLVSVTIVGVIMSTLILGLFGGVVEEGRATATYDSGTNTIYVYDTPNTLSIIDAFIPDDIFW
ncbi:MAG: hypothetical protein V3U20_03945, partial [Thermoplasmata archaeon]